MYVQHQPTYQLGFVMMSERVFCCLGRGRATCDMHKWECHSHSILVRVIVGWMCFGCSKTMNVRQSQPESDSSSCICCYVRMCVCLIELFFRILFGVSGRFVSGISLLLLLLLLYLLCTIFIFHSDFHIFLVFRIFFLFLYRCCLSLRHSFVG